jgi:valyl-tRNA synthetase
MDKTYNPQKIEQDIYTFWEKNKLFAPKGAGKPFCIVIPPPNVTGFLHMGHALDNTLQDTLIRYKRMQGYRTLWLPGTDHAGIATQNVVEKKLLEEGLSRHDLGREKFLARVWEWKEQYGSRIMQQLRRLGSSLSWDHERFTLDQGCLDAVQEVFVALYKEGLIYQGDYIINWCPRCHTALSEVEVEHEDCTGHLWHYKYFVVKNGQPEINSYIEIATTRPETMFGDTAIAVHPDDQRYQALVGQKVRIPLTQRDIPIIADQHVDPKFGSGAVKVTPAHDPNDYEIGKRHQLEFIKVFDESAVMNERAPKPYQGLERYACRKQLLADLEREGYLVATKEHQHAVGHCYRCHTIIEPYLSKQWFVAMKSLVEPALEAVKTGKIKFIPQRWAKAYFAWMENIRDWCISRQIWWGHRIPVWYCEECGKTLCQTVAPQTCTCGSKNLRQDPDVLDTWFSSALWPFSTLGWPKNTADLKTFYPTSVLITGYDIITFWVSRMITMGLKFQKKVPFKKVFIHGLVRDASGRKMSKSTGNAVDPLALIKRYGTDALRFTMLNLSTSGGQDIKLADEKIMSCRNFVNKIWNVSRYVFCVIEENSGFDITLKVENFDLADQWIMSRLHRTIQEITKLLDEFSFGGASTLFYQFVWHDFCDWYVELSKHRKESALGVLVYVLEQILRLGHPFLPFVTEAIWGTLQKTTPLIISKWPQTEKKYLSCETEKTAALIFDLIHQLRNLRAEVGLPPTQELVVIYQAQDQKNAQIIADQKFYLQKLAHLKSLTANKEQPKQALYLQAKTIDLFIPSQENQLDLTKEQQRLHSKQKKLQNEILRLEKKLQNEIFCKKAPIEVIKKEQEKLSGYRIQKNSSAKTACLFRKLKNLDWLYKFF